MHHGYEFNYITVVNPYWVVDAEGYAMCVSASLERAKDRLWEIENEGWEYAYVPPLSITNNLDWEGNTAEP